MPLVAIFGDASSRTFGFTSWLLSKIYDSFARVTSGSLGQLSSGQTWNAVTGVWTANNGVATTASTPSTYPMATVAFKTNATLTLENITPGSGITFWEADSGDWWGATSTVAEVQVQTGTSCVANSCCSGSNTCVSNSCCTTTTDTCVSNSCCTGSNTCVSNSCCTGSNTCVSNTCCTKTCNAPCALNSAGNCMSGSNPCSETCVSNSCCTGSNTCVSNSCCTGSNTCVSSTCCTGSPSTCVANSCCTGSNTCVYNSCCSTTPVYTYYYNYTLQIIKSVAAAITSVASSMLSQLTVSGGVNGIQSIEVVTNGTAVTATAYSDGALATSIGSVSGTAPATPTATGVGIMLVAVDSTASTIQGTNVGSFSGK